MSEEMNKKYKILFLDDDEFITDMYTHKFSGAGHDFRSAPDARLALEELKNGFIPDAIVVDLIMPKTDGFEFLHIANENNLVGDAAVIVLSNQGEIEDLTRARELGAIGHIIKANSTPTEVLSITTELIYKHKINNS